MTALRSYTYDTNTADSSYSAYAWGRLTTVQYNVPSHSSVFLSGGVEVDLTSDTVTEMYSYGPGGVVGRKRMRITRNASRGNSPTDDLNASWSYDTEGRLTGITYPCDANNPNGCSSGPSYTYAYNGLGQLNGMTDSNNSTVVTGVQYNAAGQLTQMISQMPALPAGTQMGTELRTYNTMGQLTSVAVTTQFNTGTPVNMTYNYPQPGQNNGKITSQTDNLPGGEQVTYAYDSLNRLISAQAGSSWGQGFQYDGFGNLTAKTVIAGSVPTLSVGVYPATNQIIGQTYDANGNMLSSPVGVGTGLAYDAENRLASVVNPIPGTTWSATVLYAYDAQNKRIWNGTSTYDNTGALIYSEQYSFYGPNGKLLSQFTPHYNVYSNGQTNNASLTMTGPTTGRLYFGSRLLGNEDRLGSRGKYFPHWGERSSQNPANDSVKFATYTRDSATGLDYADQRYYAASFGRFLSPDPYKSGAGSGTTADPGSWNRYAYVVGDPVNFFDRRGLQREGSDNCNTNPDDPSCLQPDDDGDYDEPARTQGGAKGTITIKNWTSTSAQAIGVQNSLRWIQSAIGGYADCNGWLSGNADVIDTILGQTTRVTTDRVGVGNFTNSDPSTITNAVAGVVGTNLPDGSALLTVNLDGAFFKSGVSAGSGVTGINGGSDQAKLFILLHELAHLTSAQGFQENDSGTAIQSQNNKLLLQHCGDFIKSVRN